MNTHNLKIDFGKHKGVLYTRVPINYLFWMVQCNHSHADVAKAEIERRGAILPKIDISGHAINSASIRLINVWKKNSNGKEGLYSWLVRFCEEAISKHKINDSGVIFHKGIKLVFECGEFPVLKTCMLENQK